MSPAPTSKKEACSSAAILPASLKSSVQPEKSPQSAPFGSNCRLLLQTLDLLLAPPKKPVPTPSQWQTPTRQWPSTSAPGSPVSATQPGAFPAPPLNPLL